MLDIVITTLDIIAILTLVLFPVLIPLAVEAVHFLGNGRFNSRLFSSKTAGSDDVIPARA